MAPSPHDHQDLKDAHATHPPTGRVLWFNVASGENLTAFATCGGLASYTTPIGPEGIVYRKRTGIQAMDTLRFHPQCLRFYITLCVHFMPRKIKDAVMTLVVQAGHPLKTVDKSTQTENSNAQGEGADRMQVDGPRVQTTLATLPGHHDDTPDFISPPLPLFLKHLVSVFICVAIGTLLAGWAWTGLPGTSLEEPVAELPGTIIAQSSSPGSTNDSNLSGSSSATLANRPPYEAVKEILAAAEFVPLAEDDEIGAAQVKANLEHLFPDLVLNGYTAIELQRHHQSLVFKAALLLRLSASIQSTNDMPQ
ncbi:hypothetical protein C8F04DRAFT_701478 [Mycena alexandri]|uniref:Uncharacterized protein n=1 Tax=Mycena alexandri TaxID=1745969 RepID=A0AAD6X0I7_9AGAR|nr:hypothetical protein C8F04DRAFT_701478 [Mycena alexandri]